MIIWTTLAYVVTTVAIVIVRGAHVSLSAGNGWAAASGALAVLGLIALFVALDKGDMTRVVPVTAAYPLFTAALVCSYSTSA